MKLNQVAAITSSVGRFCKDEEGLADSLKKIRDIGYPAVQISGIGPIEDQKVADLCGELGLTICATHEKNMRFVEEPEAIVRRVQTLGCSIAGYPYPHPGGFESMDDVRSVIDALARAGKVLHEAGVTAVYHNHDVEFLKFDGKLVLDMIYDQVDPRYLQGEPDTFWIQAGGGDPVAWCEKLKGRLPVLHMKDFGTRGKREIEIKAIGEGNLDWPRIVRAAEDAGCEWFVVEHDGGTFEDLATSFDYITSNLVE